MNLISGNISSIVYKNFLKRFLDFCLSFSIILALCPVFIIISLLLFIFNNKQVLFVQSRPGKNGKVIKLIKFKTMNDRKDKDGNLLPDTIRLTWLGRLLRASSLDEIPQFLNVLKGDLSIIGPRPLLIRYLPLYSESQSRRHEIRPGITGWAQVNGRNTISWEQKFEYDVWYVDNVSFLLDMKILFLTVKKVLFIEGINAGARVTMGEFRGNEESRAAAD